MGLDIYFHKVANVRKSKNDVFDMTIEDLSNLAHNREKARVKRFCNKVIRDLSKLEGAEYEEYYKKVFPNKVKKYTKYEWKYEKMVEKVQPLEEVKKWLDNFLECCYKDSDAYFRKVNFVYKYFEPKLEDECCLVSKTDLEDLIARCDAVLNNHDLAESLLPTTSGFFFGSTEYDDWYFADVKDARSQFKKLLRGFHDDTDVIYVVMSW